MPDININAKVPDGARDRVKEALEYSAKNPDTGEDKDQTEEDFVAESFKIILNKEINKRLRRKARREAQVEEVDIDVSLL